MTKDRNKRISNDGKILDPCLDVVSKMLLSSPDCRDGLIDLISCIITPPSPIASIEVLNPIVPRQLVDERGVELDLLLRLDDGSHVNLEMQTSTSKILPHRALYHWARVYSAQLKVGDLHPALRAVRSIFLVKHPLYIADPDVAHHIIRAYREPLMVAMDEAQQIARARELGMLRVSMELDEARDEGLQKGREEGRQEGRQEGRDEGLQKGLELGQRQAQAAMIRKFMDGGMSLDQLAAVIKMTKEELEFLLSLDQG